MENLYTPAPMSQDKTASDTAQGLLTESYEERMTNYILAVDDNPDNLFLVQLALEQEGHQVKLVDSGAAALSQIDRSPPDLILLDVMMPEMDGYEVVRRLRNNSHLPFIPVLMITAHEQSSVVEGLDAGADEFIRKPVKVDELQARVRSLLRLKQSVDQRENFVHCLTHDLRTPLVAIDRMLELIRKEAFGEISAQAKEALGNVLSSNHNLLSMLNNLLEVYCYDVGQKILSFIDFSALELVNEVVQELSPLAAEKGLDLRVQSVSESVKLEGDRLELRRVVANLVGNAIKFTDKGYVEVRIDERDRDLVLEIEDTGIGIDPADQAKIFQRFRQGNHLRAGNGLGLHLCHQIVQSHCGQIEVQSEPEQGTLFRIRLPCKQQ